MHTQARFENSAALANILEALARDIAMAVVSSQIAKRLLAFKDCRRSNLFRLRPIGSHIGAIPRLRQGHFHRASGIAMRLSPEKSETLESGMPRGFAVGVSYSRSHLASSRAQ
jgi:hypothetical protein